MDNKVSNWIENRLSTLQTYPLPILGCLRRNLWSTPWTSDAAVAVLEVVGRRATLEWRGEKVDIFTTPGGDSLLMWRGGKWRDWWIVDMYMLAGMVQRVSNFRAIGVYMLHEVDGRTHVRYVETPAWRVQTAYLDLMAAWAKNPDVPPRINRCSNAAKYLCGRCPVRARCEASDMESGETQDWS